ncbi:MAG: ECF transporter S component [Oscillospiraceae bacterium]|jgi:uncharacterized membrane protein|nr:ECF transporter S component [Oscillospiraceae bacterium]
MAISKSLKSFKSSYLQKLVLLAFLTAIIVVLQLLAAIVPVYPFKLNLVLVPIVIGAALVSPLAGAWLGLVFGFVVIVSSPDVLPFMVFNPLATVAIILTRGIVTGFVTGWVYKILQNKGKTIAALVAATVCPIINTGIFIIGIYVFFLPLLAEWGVSGAADIASFIFIAMVGLNFIFELAINLALSPTIVRLVQYKSSGQEGK